MRKTYGYVRVSSQDQNEARQYLELLDMGIDKKYIYMDKLSGKDFNRPAYHKLVYKKLKQGDLIGTLIGDIVLQLLSFVAENERVNIHQRQAEGIRAAKMRGVRFGRPKIALPEDFEEIVYLWQQGELQSKEAIAISGLKYSTFYKKVKELEDGKLNSETSR